MRVTILKRGSLSKACNGGCVQVIVAEAYMLLDYNSKQ